MHVYSYARFSSGKQAKGASIERQVEATVAYCERHGHTLDAALTFRDLGVSAFAGKNARRGDLAAFLAAITSGRVRPGEALAVESVDRLSREGIDRGYDLCKQILRAGVWIVTLSPEREYGPDAVKGLAKGALELLIILERAQEESQTKSDRARRIWEKRRANRQPWGACPAWLRIVDRRFIVIPSHAALVRQMYAWALEGRGPGWIAKELNRTHTPLIATLAGPRKASKVWHKSYVNSILHSRAVIGIHAPSTWDHATGRSVPVGVEYPDYYPVIVDPSLYHRVQGLWARRRRATGRQGVGVPSLFSGLIYDARDGSGMRCVEKSPGMRSLVASASIHGTGLPYISFPLTVFEAAFLSLVSELRPADVNPPAASGESAEVERLEAEASALDARVETLKSRMASDSNLDTLADVVSRLVESRRAVGVQLDAARGRQAPQTTSDLRDAQTVAGLLADAPADAVGPLRLRLQGAIRRLVASIHLLPVAVGKLDRLAAVQIRLTSGAARDLLIFHRGTRGNYSTRRPAEWWAKSLDPAEAGREVDLRDVLQAASLASALTSADVTRCITLGSATGGEIATVALDPLTASAVSASAGCSDERVRLWLLRMLLASASDAG